MENWSVKKRVIIILITGVILALISFLAGNSKSLKSLTRESYDGETKTEEVLVTVDGILDKESMKIEVEPQRYSSDEIKEIFGLVMDKLDTVVLGENTTFDEVVSDLDFVDKVEDYPISVAWELDSYDVLDTSGRIIVEEIPKSGVVVEIRGILSYADQEAIYIRNVHIFPKKKSKKEMAIDELTNALEREKEDSKEIQQVKLPQNLDGKSVKWRYPPNHTSWILLLLSVVAAAMMPALKKQKESEMQKEKNEQMLSDYPKIIGDFTLLLETGMTIRQVFERMVRQYEKQEKRRYAYEEIKETYYEMLGGVPEVEAYEHFGERCGLSVYRKFGALLSQNLMKGTRGLASLLQMEAIQADEDRKARGRKQAEEAGTKLLIPMFIMLGVVMAIVIFPAFLSMNV